MAHSIRPGVEINIKSAPRKLPDRPGIVAFQVPLEFGPENPTQPFVVTQSDDVEQLFEGFNVRIQEVVSDMLRSCKEIHIYTTPSSKHAKCSVTISSKSIELIAPRVGTYGNKYKVVVSASGNKFDVVVTVDGKAKEDVREISTWEEFAKKTQVLRVDFKDLNPSEAILEAGTLTLEGGSTSPLTIEEYTNVLAGLQRAKFNVWVTPPYVNGAEQDAIENATDKTIYDIRELDDRLDVYIVTSESSGNPANTNKEFKFVLKQTGLITKWGTEYPDYEAKLILGSLIAGLNPAQEFTNYCVDFAREVLNPLGEGREIDSALLDGYTMFFEDENGDVRIVKDQTNYTEFNTNVDPCFTSGLPLRIVDYVIMHFKRDFVVNWLGKIKLTKNTAKAYKDCVYTKLEEFQRDGFLEDVKPEDVVVEIIDRRSLRMKLGLQPTEAMEKLYIDVEVR